MKHVRAVGSLVVALTLGAIGLDAHAGTPVCYRLPFNDPNLADGWGSLLHRATPHRGVDFPQPTGTPIPSVADGVVRVKAYSSCLGNVVVVEHPDGMFSGYCHMNSASPLAVGAKISKSDIVGKVGATGSCARGAHLHLTMSASVAGWGYGTTVDPYKYIEAHKTCNAAPKGSFDVAACDSVSGWAQDPDAPTAASDVKIYFGGPKTDATAYAELVHANAPRADLCKPLGSCNHAFATVPPLSFFDGASHPIFAYALDSKGGASTTLGEKQLKCDRLPIPQLATGVVKRRVTSAAALAAWNVKAVNVATVTDAALQAIPLGPDLPDAPALGKVAGDPKLYLREYDTARPIPTAAVLDAWGLVASTAREIPAAELEGSLVGADWLAHPVLLKGTTDTVYLVDSPPPLWGELVDDDLPVEMAAGAVTDVSLHFRNRGTMTWNASNVELVPTPDDAPSPLCDPSWSSCVRAATVAGDVPPAAETTFHLRLHAPTDATTLTTCFGLRAGTHSFAARGQNGPADDATCRTIAITPTDASSEVGSEADGEAPPDAAGGGCRAAARGPDSSSSTTLYRLLATFIAVGGVVLLRRRASARDR
jgi:hypothetical protein